MSFTHRGRTLNKIAVIGSGQIGPDIALFFSKVFSPLGVRTVVVDVADEALQRGQAKLEKKLVKDFKKIPGDPLSKGIPDEVVQKVQELSEETQAAEER